MDIADKGARVGNFIVDTLLIIALLLIQFLIMGTVMYQVLADHPTIVEIYPFAFYFLYYFVFEYFTGTTPGKRLTKTRVVNYGGQKPGLLRLLLRNICRLTFHDYFSFVFGQGFHDGISRTLVVKVGKNKHG